MSQRAAHSHAHLPHLPPRKSLSSAQLGSRFSVCATATAGARFGNKDLHFVRLCLGCRAAAMGSAMIRLESGQFLSCQIAVKAAWPCSSSCSAPSDRKAYATRSQPCRARIKFPHQIRKRPRVVYKIQWESVSMWELLSVGVCSRVCVCVCGCACVCVGVLWVKFKTTNRVSVGRYALLTQMSRET